MTPLLPPPRCGVCARRSAVIVLRWADDEPSALCCLCADLVMIRTALHEVDAGTITLESAEADWAGWLQSPDRMDAYLDQAIRGEYHAHGISPAWGSLELTRSHVEAMTPA